MNYSNGWYDYLTNLQQYVRQMDAKIAQLEARITQLENNATNPKHTKHTNIEKLEYHFDQLKIERLDGTLHIGLSPEDLEKVDSMDINPVPTNDKAANNQQSLQQQIVSQLDAYVMDQGPALVEQMAQESGYPMNESYRTMILNDVRNQIPTRVSHYATDGQQKTHIQDDNQLSSYVVEQVQKEISHSLRQFFLNDVNKGDQA